MKLYMVTSGFYSEYTVHGIFTSVENAEAYIGTAYEHSSYGGHRLLEIESDVEIEDGREGADAIFVFMDKGGALASKREECDALLYGNAYKFRNGMLHIKEWCKMGDTPRHALMYVGWKDYETAVKIANERRLIMIAENKWPEDIS